MQSYLNVITYFKELDARVVTEKYSVSLCKDIVQLLQTSKNTARHECYIVCYVSYRPVECRVSAHFCARMRKIVFKSSISMCSVYYHHEHRAALLPLPLHVEKY